MFISELLGCEALVFGHSEVVPVFDPKRPDQACADQEACLPDVGEPSGAVQLEQYVRRKINIPGPLGLWRIETMLIVDCYLTI